MNDKVVCIVGRGSISPLGAYPAEILQSYASDISSVCAVEIGGREVLAAPLSENSNAALGAIADEDRRYASLDRSVLMAIHAARQCVDEAGWNSSGGQAVNKNTLVSIGSSRGATSTLEEAKRVFMQKGRVPVLTSPMTTLGAVSSWVAQDLGVGPFAISHSMTCSTALEAVANGVAWLKSGLCTRAIVGGTEAPLTSFTISQMEALSIYGDKDALPYPTTPLAAEYSKGSGMVLGEGACLFALELKDRESVIHGKDIVIEGIGFGSESITHPISISEDGQCLFDAMKGALSTAQKQPDGLIVHAPGTEAGDKAEYSAIGRLFGNDMPRVTTNKWKIGHTLGASGAFSMEYAALLLENKVSYRVPYQTCNLGEETKCTSFLVNSAGFGGHAISVRVSL